MFISNPKNPHVTEIVTSKNSSELSNNPINHSLWNFLCIFKYSLKKYVFKKKSIPPLSLMYFLKKHCLLQCKRNFMEKVRMRYKFSGSVNKLISTL